MYNMFLPIDIMIFIWSACISLPMGLIIGLSCSHIQYAVWPDFIEYKQDGWPPKVVRIMKLSEVLQLTEATLVCGENRLGNEVEKAFSSDLMSDVLTIDSDDILLITGLSNPQAIRTAEMADIHFILLVRNKKATDEMVEIARENGMVLMETSFSLYKSSGILYSAGLNPVY